MSDVLTDEERWIVDAERHFVEQGFPDNGKGKLLAIIDKLTRELEVASEELRESRKAYWDEAAACIKAQDSLEEARNEIEKLKAGA